MMGLQSRLSSSRRSKVWCMYTLYTCTGTLNHPPRHGQGWPEEEGSLSYTGNGSSDSFTARLAVEGCRRSASGHHFPSLGAASLSLYWPGLIPILARIPPAVWKAQVTERDHQEVPLSSCRHRPRPRSANDSIAPPSSSSRAGAGAAEWCPASWSCPAQVAPFGPTTAPGNINLQCCMLSRRPTRPLIMTPVPAHLSHSMAHLGYVGKVPCAMPPWAAPTSDSPIQPVTRWRSTRPSPGHAPSPACRRHPSCSLSTYPVYPETWEIACLARPGIVLVLV